MTPIFLNDSEDVAYGFNQEMLLEPIDKDQQPEQTRVFLMGNSCVIHSIEMPLKQERQILKALPFALEEVISTDLDDTHVHYLGKKEGRAYSLVIDKGTLRRLSDDPIIMAASYLPLALPISANEITVVIIDGYAYIRSSAFNAYSIPLSLLEASLEQLIVSGDEVTAISLCDLTSSANNEVDPLLLASLENLGVEIKLADREVIISSIIDDNKKNENLFTGSYKKAERKKVTKVFKFKPLLFMLSAALILLLFIFTNKAMQINAQADAVNKASIEFYSVLFPEETVRPRLMRKLFNNALASRGSTALSRGGFTNLLSKVAQEAKSDKNIGFDSIKYSSKKNTIELGLTSKNVNQLEKLKKNLVKKNLKVEIASANQKGNSIKSILKVTGNE